MKNKKGQAAMEFLMTYGWAILAAVIVIGVLASFGVFSSKNYIPTSCSLTAPFGCDKNQVSADLSENTVSLVMNNGGGQTYDIVGVSLTGCTGAVTATLNGSVVAVATPVSLPEQDPQTLAITCGGLALDQKFTGSLTISYIPDGGTMTLQSSGSVTVKVAA